MSVLEIIFVVGDACFALAGCGCLAIAVICWRQSRRLGAAARRLDEQDEGIPDAEFDDVVQHMRETGQLSR